MRFIERVFWTDGVSKRNDVKSMDYIDEHDEGLMAFGAFSIFFFPSFFSSFHALGMHGLVDSLAI
jgi:hypothetical protein